MSSLLVKSLTFYLKSLLIRKGGNMVVLQVLTHNVVVAREGKGEWVLVKKGIGFGKKKGDTIVATNLEKKYRKIE
ncbi:MAG: CAT RNA binding domain-containing protein [Enterococcus avium]